MGSLSVKNTAANISPFRTLEAFTGYGIRAPCGLIPHLRDYKLSSMQLLFGAEHVRVKQLAYV